MDEKDNILKTFSSSPSPIPWTPQVSSSPVSLPPPTLELVRALLEGISEGCRLYPLGHEITCRVLVCGWGT